MGVPDVNPVVHPSTLLLTANTVTVEAVPGSYVGISKNGELYGSAYVDQSGVAVVDITPFGVPGEVDIVVSCQNHEPYISTMMVIAPDGPYCIYDSSVVSEVVGNGNGVVDAGESLSMGIRIRNVGPDQANDVDATLSTLDTFVTITDNSEYYGSIAGDDGVMYIADGFAFGLDSSTPDGHRVTFTLTVTGTNRDTWEGDFTLGVHAPDLQYGLVSIDDAGGNANGILDPGETVGFAVTLSNFGSGEALAVQAGLSATDTYVSIDDGSGYFGDLDSLGGAAVSEPDGYTVTALSGCPMGYAVTFTLNVTGANGLSLAIPFEVVIGDRVAFFVDDFSFDQGWSGLGGTAEWTIGAATGGTGSDSYGGPDPSVDHTPTGDNGVMGNDLTSGTGGDYNGGIGSAQWATSPLIDCSDYTGVQLRFWHWLGVESPSYDHAYVEVYDGSSWVRLWENDAGVDAASWTESFYDVSAYADANPDFQIRFGLGPTDGSWNYCGWNLDDLELKGYDQSGEGDPILSFASTVFADSVLGGETAQGTVRVYNTGDGNLRIRFVPTVDWLTCSTDQNYVSPGDSLDFPFTIDAVDLEPGDYFGQLHFTSNDYATQSGDIDVDLHIHTPSAAFSSEVVYDSLATGDTSSAGIWVYNNGLGALHVTFTANDPWLSCAGDEFTVYPADSMEFMLSLDCGGLNPGDYVGTVSYTTDDPELSGGDISVYLNILSPVCDIPTVSIDESLAPGDSVAVPLMIYNNGPGRLAYNIGAQAFDTPSKEDHTTVAAVSRQPLGYRSTGDDKGDGDMPFFAPVAKGLGGPDAFGYSWIDSDEAGGPVFNWVDISSTGTALSLSDDGASAALDLGFTFPYYDSNYTQVYVSSNGLVTFGSGTSERVNSNIPNGNVPNAVIAVWWDDLDPVDQGQVLYRAEPGRFIVSYVDVPNYQYPTGTGSLTFQVILYSSGKVTLQYQTMDAGEDAEGLSGATIGIENPAGDDGLEVTYDAPYIHDNMAIDFNNVRWIWVEPGGGLIDPYSSAEVFVNLDAAELTDGVYTGQLAVSTNDPALPGMAIPVSVSITSWVCGDVNGDGNGPVVSDLTYLVDFLFRSGPPPPEMAAADMNGQGGDIIGVSDLTYLVDFLFRSGPQPICH